MSIEGPEKDMMDNKEAMFIIIVIQKIQNLKFSLLMPLQLHRAAQLLKKIAI